MYVLVLLIFVGHLPPALVMHDFTSQRACDDLGKAVGLLVFDRLGDDAKTVWRCVRKDDTAKV